LKVDRNKSILCFSILSAFLLIPTSILLPTFAETKQEDESIKEDFDLEHKTLEPPLKQFKNGVKFSDIDCRVGLELITNPAKNKPACVKPETAEKLVQRGWQTFMLVDKTQELVNKAIEIYDNEKDTSFEQITFSSNFKVDNIYVFVLDEDGVRVAHGENPDLVGQQVENMPDNRVRDTILSGATEKGEWVEYKRSVPNGDEMLHKKS